eukprot:3095075-Rhodomonas_salina.3
MARHLGPGDFGHYSEYVDELSLDGINFFPEIINQPTGEGCGYGKLYLLKNRVVSGYSALQDGTASFVISGSFNVLSLEFADAGLGLLRVPAGILL